jgi:hypothetical protein
MMKYCSYYLCPTAVVYEYIANIGLPHVDADGYSGQEQKLLGTILTPPMECIKHFAVGLYAL